MAQKRPAHDTEYVSLGLKYETDLLDLIKGRSGLENAEIIVQHSFTVLDKCIPELGQFVRVMKLVRDQLFDAVYSEKITECGGKVARLPYFKIIESTEVSAEKRLDLKSKDMDAITKRLYDKQVEYENLEAEFAATGSEVRTLQKSLKKQMDTNDDLTEKIARLEATMATQADQADQTIRSLRLKVAEMKHELDSRQDSIDELKKFEKGYAHLEKTFFRWPLKITNRVKNESAKESSSPLGKAFRTSSEKGRYEAAQTISMALTKQVEELEQQLINDFEVDAESIKTVLVNRRLITDNLDAGIDAEEEEMGFQAKKAIRFEKVFTGFMNLASSEVELLREHKVNMTALKVGRELKAKQEASDVDPDDESKDILPSEPVAEAAENPFIPNELILSKFSIIVQVSQDGLHFYDLPVNEPCGMCGLMSVLVCPHRILSKQITIPLTPNTLYLRILRPVLRTSNADIVAPPSSADYAKPATPDLPHRAKSDVSTEEAATGGGAIAYGRPKPKDLGDEKSLATFVHVVNEKAESRLYGAKPRQLTDAQLYSYCEEFLAYLFSCEYTNPPKVASVFENFFGHLEQTYRSKNAAHLVAEDVLENIPPRVVAGDRYLQLFALGLTGVVDSAMLKYASLLADATMTIDWKHPADYWAFALVVYPFLDDEDVDIVQMNFTSFTEGKINAAVVLEYQLFCLLRGTEMRYQNMFEQLHEMASGHPCFSEEEFIRAARDLLPKSIFDYSKTKALFEEAHLSTRMWKMREDVIESSLAESLARSPSPKSKKSQPPRSNVTYYPDAISTERAAQIMCYLDLAGIFPFVKDNLWNRVLEMRTSAPAQFDILSPVSNRESGSKTRNIVRYTDAHKMAFQYNKFKRFKLREALELEQEQKGKARQKKTSIIKSDK